MSIAVDETVNKVSSVAAEQSGKIISCVAYASATEIDNATNRARGGIEQNIARPKITVLEHRGVGKMAWFAQEDLKMVYNSRLGFRGHVRQEQPADSLENIGPLCRCIGSRYQGRKLTGYRNAMKFGEEGAKLLGQGIMDSEVLQASEAFGPQWLTGYEGIAYKSSADRLVCQMNERWRGNGKANEGLNMLKQCSFSGECLNTFKIFWETEDERFIDL